MNDPRPHISAIGRATYGEQWIAALARARGLNIRTVQRYATGEVEPSPGVYAEAVEDLNRHIREASAVLRRARRAAA